MRFLRLTAGVVTPLLLLGACAQQPMGPTIGVMPPPGKPFSDFQADQALCQNYAANQVQGGVQQSNNTQVGTALVGTLLGAGLGAAIGGGRGAAIGAASGALGGTMVGGAGAERSNANIQQVYNLNYAQCMYSRGNQVPGYAPPAPPQGGYPPPPGYPPPGYAPQGYAPQGYAPQGYAPQGYAPPGYPPPLPNG